jgi:hypothetical protein
MAVARWLFQTKAIFWAGFLHAKNIANKKNSRPYFMYNLLFTIKLKLNIFAI